MPRKIRPEAVALLDARLRDNPLAQDCIRMGRSRQLIVEAAKACLGIRESSTNRGLEVELFQKTVGVRAGDAWCMAFVQTCLAYAELKTRATSPVRASGSCMTVWNDTSTDLRVKQLPLAGAIAIWQHTNEPAKGHTGIILDCDGVSFHAIEGNTADGHEDINGAVGQIGDGVGFTHRRYDLFNPQKGDMQFRGSLRPFS